MKTVMIPTFMSPYKCTINGVTYVYPAGTEQTVPDEVAALIEANAAATDYGKRPSAGGSYVDPMEESGLFSGRVVPPFADATPEQIAWIAKNDDPSKYWSVGDYRVKTIEVPDYSKCSVTWDADESSIGGLENVKQFFDMTGINESGEYLFQWGMGEEDWFGDIYKDGREIWHGNPVTDLSFDLYAGGTCFLSITYAESEETAYLSISGFNHDNVVNKSEYGKQKAGLTLMCGASRERTGNDKVGVFLPKIAGMVDSNGYYERSNKYTKNYESNTAYRSNLQKVLDYFPEFAPFVQPVVKYTAQYYRHSNRYTQWLVTEDKVFLPSEFELFSEVVLSPNKEGEQYELFRLGESKIIVTPELAEGYTAGSNIVYSRLWLRSAAAQYVNPKLPPVSNTYTPLNNLSDNSFRVGDDSDYNNSVIMSYNQSKGQYNYSPSVAHSNGYPAYILPMFCL